MSFPEALREIAEKVERCLDEFLSAPHSPAPRLTAAMRSAVLGARLSIVFAWRACRAILTSAAGHYRPLITIRRPA